MDVMESLSSAVDPLKCAVRVSLGEGAIRSARNSWKKWNVGQGEELLHIPLPMSTVGCIEQRSQNEKTGEALQ